jgi:uncharacterized protein with von Willebrand factor type A (vWA) domain
MKYVVTVYAEHRVDHYGLHHVRGIYDTLEEVDSAIKAQCAKLPEFHYRHTVYEIVQLPDELRGILIYDSENVVHRL